MKRLTSILLLILTVATAAQAVPAWRQWHQAVLADGTAVEVTLCGDEWYHWMEDACGRRYQESADGCLAPLSSEEHQAGMARRASRIAKEYRCHPLRQPRRSLYQGQRKGLIILVQFPDLPMQDADAQAVWERYANGNLDDLGHQGSIHDYFLDQSNGLFDLTFDVAGPVTMEQEAAYYGENDSYGQDFRSPIMLEEACRAIADTTDFRRYDWDNDGEVEQVFLLYAGRGENTSRKPSLIWPHKYSITGWQEDGYIEYNVLRINGVIIDSYACSCELSYYNQLDGIGTICHEFSHCLGLPDLYDTDTGRSVLGDWDLMDQGEYNQGGWSPPNYSAYERAACGWLQLKELSIPTTVTALLPLGDGGAAYRITNDCWEQGKEEYYIVENRQKTGWDSSLPEAGLLITHIDYDETLWEDNRPNANRSHLCVSYISPLAYNMRRGVTYPYQQLDSLTDVSQPAAQLYNMNRRGAYLMGKPLTGMTISDDGLASFHFMGGSSSAVSPTPVTRSASSNELYDLLGRRGAARSIKVKDKRIFLSY